MTSMRTESGCLLATNAVDSHGYAYANLDGRSTRAHQKAFVLAHGPVPEGHVVGHRCHDEALAAGTCSPGVCEHRRCVEPEHLIAMTVRENAQALRKSHCLRGHPKTERRCGTCNRDRMRKVYALARKEA